MHGIHTPLTITARFFKVKSRSASALVRSLAARAKNAVDRRHRTSLTFLAAFATSVVEGVEVQPQLFGTQLSGARKNAVEARRRSTNEKE